MSTEELLARQLQLLAQVITELNHIIKNLEIVTSKIYDLDKAGIKIDGNFQAILDSLKGQCPRALELKERCDTLAAAVTTCVEELTEPVSEVKSEVTSVKTDLTQIKADVDKIAKKLQYILYTLAGIATGFGLWWGFHSFLTGLGIKL